VVQVCVGGWHKADAGNSARPQDGGGAQRRSLMAWALNLEWLVLATVMCWLWLRHARREGPGRQVQFIALAMVLVIMFTVIGLYDDMAMVQNPTEASCFQREDLSGARAHAMLHPVVNFTQPLFSEQSFDVFYLGVVADRPTPVLRSAALGSIQNRPPPAV
jgi:hypothetical protein